MRAKTANVRSRPHRVAVLTFDRLSMFEFAIACEVFGPTEAADLGVPWYEFVVCGERGTVRFENGLLLPVPAGLGALARADTVVVPPTDDPAGVPPATLAALRRSHARGTRILSLCTGAFVLARAGLLDGRRAVTHWAECAEFAQQFPQVTVDPGVLYVDEGDILTSAGSAASIDLCLHVVRADHGAEIASALARLMVVPPHRDGGQAQYVDAPMPAPPVAEPLADTITWMAEHLDADLSIAALAARASMSPRSFARHFVATTGSTPYQWLLHQRVHHAQRLLESTDLPIEVVAARVGLSNAVNLRKHFRRVLGTSPQSYRRTFQTPAVG